MDHAVTRYRHLFPSLSNNIQLSSCSQSAIATPVREAVGEYFDSLHARGMDWELWMTRVAAAKAEFARMINADEDEVAVCASVTEAAGLIASALDYPAARNKVLMTEMDFPSIGHLWLAQQRFGAQVQFVESDNDAVPTERFIEAIDERARLVCISQVCFYNGYRQDVAQITRQAHAHGALVFVDAYQASGSEPMDVKATPIDMLASGMQKYLLGLPGIAFLYVRREVALKLEPSLTGWFGRSNPFEFDIRKLDYAPNANRFDVGTPPMMAAYAAHAALQLINQVGVGHINAWQKRLSQVALETAAAHGLVVASPTDLSCKAANTAIRVAQAKTLEGLMAKEGFIVSARSDVLRIAPHFYNTEADVRQAIECLAALDRQLNLR
ncbi:aminotransferase class V-fold PLP-dependent enzyme [Pseudomonas putida]|uniref:aminotransferase class V-fold PLP-dependent enzyme n=1 Tax=Pseudomonas putida TaxID=303 RepID=UPI00383B9D32